MTARRSVRRSYCQILRKVRFAVPNSYMIFGLALRITLMEMPDGFSDPLINRLRVDGHTQHGIAQLLRISLSTVKRYLVRYQASGSVAATVAKRKQSTFSGL